MSLVLGILKEIHIENQFDHFIQFKNRVDGAISWPHDC